MMWIHATPAQRAALVRRCEVREEAVRRSPAVQKQLQKQLAELQTRIAALTAEQEAGGNTRRITRQIAECRRVIDEEISPNLR